ncbi:MAG TPA: type II toxin-antitoxin system death-on-curing family toxin [Stellaceae bacterium]|nr:type II toxin-antitoxin system death-on-curing family toxin [Stellaceae bacterium]
MDEILAAHEAALRFGGRPGVHDQRLIESAITRPYTGYYRHIAQKAAALVQSLATNHGFVDGNKRTAIFAMNLLLGESGYRLRGEHEFERHNAEVEEMVLAVVERRMSFARLVAWFRERVVRERR